MDIRSRRSAWVPIAVAAATVVATLTAGPAFAGTNGSGHAQGDASGASPQIATSYPAPVPAGYAVHGIDVSHYQGAIDWAALKSSGTSFAYAKATEGGSSAGDDATYAGNVTAARAAGLYAGAYHYARPDDPNAAGQADHFLDVIDYAPGGLTLPPFLDLESGATVGLSACYGLSAGAMVNWITGFSNEFAARTGGQKVMIYVTASYWSDCVGNTSAFADHPLDIVHWGSQLTNPGTLPGAWQDYTFWQYTDEASAEPCGCGPVDGMVFHGDLAGLAAFAGSGASTARIGVRSTDFVGRVKEGGVGANFVDEATNARAVVVDGRRIAVLQRNRTLQVKDGALNAGFVTVSTDAVAVALSGTRIGIIDSTGKAFVKDGALNAGFVQIAGNATGIALSGTRIGVVDDTGTLRVKDGALDAAYTTVANDVTDFALSGNRIGIVSGRVASVKDGAVNAGFVQEATGVTSVVLSGSRIGVVTTGKVARVKEGALNAGWVDVATGANTLVLGGTRVGYVDGSAVARVKEGALTAGWTTVATSAAGLSLTQA